MAKSTVETLSPTRVKLRIVANADDLAQSIEAVYADVAEQVQVPGFRKGKVPKPIIDQRVGRGYILEQAANHGLDGLFRDAVNEHEVYIVGRPQADILEWPNEADFSGDLVAEIEVDVRPEVTLPDLSTITVTVDPADVDADAVNTALDSLRSRFGTLVPVDRPAKAGDFVELDLIASIDGNEVDRAQGVSYELGTNGLLEGLDEVVESLTAGEETTFRSTLLGGDYTGQEAEVAVTVTSVKERELPEADDEFAQTASEFDTIAELREALAESAQNDAVVGQASAAREKLLETLIEQLDIPVPAGLIEDEVHEHLEGENRLDDDEHRAEVTEASEKRFRSQTVLDAIGKAVEVELNNDEISQFLFEMSQQYGMQPQDFVNALQSSGQLNLMIGEAARSKALTQALRQVKIVDANGKTIDVSSVLGSDDEASEADAAEEKPAKKAPAKKATEKKPAAKQAPAKKKTDDK